jgi:hypothetical protein
VLGGIVVLRPADNKSNEMAAPLPSEMGGVQRAEKERAEENSVLALEA